MKLIRYAITNTKIFVQGRNICELYRIVKNYSYINYIQSRNTIQIQARKTPSMSFANHHPKMINSHDNQFRPINRHTLS